jgi:uncharacterized membrane protein
MSRRLLALSLLAVAAFAAAPAANADTGRCYGVVAGENSAGVCNTSGCPDVCYVQLSPYCTFGRLRCAIDPIG